MMEKLRLKEIHEFAATPQFFRNGLTDFLSFLLAHYNVYVPVVSLLKKIFSVTGCYHIIDMCSGGGGPYKQLLPLLEKEVGKKITVHLTDLNPNAPAFVEMHDCFRDQITYSLVPTDATKVKLTEKGILTFFTSFHHFSEQEVIEIFNNAITNMLPICVFEFTENTLFRNLIDCIAVPLAVFAFMPRVRRFTIGRFIFTYLIPIFPLMIWADSLLSNIRSYSPKNLLQLAEATKSSQYHWESGKIKSGFRTFNVTYLIGYPTHESIANQQSS